MNKLLTVILVLATSNLWAQDPKSNNNDLAKGMVPSAALADRPDASRLILNQKTDGVTNQGAQLKIAARGNAERSAPYILQDRPVKSSGGWDPQIESTPLNQSNVAPLLAQVLRRISFDCQNGENLSEAIQMSLDSFFSTTTISQQIRNNLDPDTIDCLRKYLETIPSAQNTGNSGSNVSN